MALTDWQERVVEERVQLIEKIRKLEDFLGGRWPSAAIISGHEFFRLNLQLRIMQLYEQVLEERVGAFKRDPA